MADPYDILRMYAAPDAPSAPSFKEATSFFRHPAVELARRRVPESASADPYNPIWDLLLGKDGGVEQPKTQYVSVGKDNVLPSRSFWEERGAGPSWIDRQAQAQAAVLGGGNSLLFGVPMAALRRWAPGTAQRVQDVIDGSGYAGTAGEVAGFVGNPANKVFRMAGEKLANKGYGLMAQGTADGLTTAGVMSVPALVEHSSIDPNAVSSVAPVAFWSRMLMPKLPNNILARAGWGAAAGTVAGLTPGHGPMAPLPEALIGALYGAAARRPPTERKWRNSRDQFLTEDRGVRNAMIGGGLGAALAVASQGTDAPKEHEPTTEELLKHFYGGDDRG